LTGQGHRFDGRAEEREGEHQRRPRQSRKGAMGKTIGSPVLSLSKGRTSVKQWKEETSSKRELEEGERIGKTDVLGKPGGLESSA